MLKLKIREFVSRLGHSRRNISKREISRFCAQLKMLLSSGVPLLEALRIVEKMSCKNGFGEIILRLSEGESLANSMAGLFPFMVTSSIESAEKIGNLEEALGRLAKYYDEQAELEEKFKSALIYPVFVLILCFLSLMVMFLFVLPGFKSLFADMDADLPFISLMIINAGEVFSAFWYVPFILLLIALCIFNKIKNTPAGALKIDGYILKIKLISQEYIMQSFRSLGSLLQGGVPVIEALKTVTNSSKNRIFQKIILEIKEMIENGERLSSALSRHPIFPRETIQMIAVGENSGKLGEMLVNIADFYEKEKETVIKRFTSILEPVLTLIVGAIVGFIVIAMFMPMVNMISKLQ